MSKPKRIFIICDLREQPTEIERIGTNKKNAIVPPIKVGEEIIKTENKHLRFYSPEAMRELKPIIHKEQKVISAFAKKKNTKNEQKIEEKNKTIFTDRIDDNSTFSYFKQLLNKIALSNKDGIIDEVKTQIRTLENAQMFIKMLFEKAINDHKYIPIYIEMYKKVYQYVLENREEIGKKMPIILIEMSENLFKKILNKEEINSMSSEDLENYKFEYTGNCKFISGLYAEQLVKKQLPLFCMKFLIENGDENGFTALFECMKLVGKIEKNEFDEIKQLLITRLSNGGLERRVYFKMEEGIKYLSSEKVDLIQLYGNQMKK